MSALRELIAHFWAGVDTSELKKGEKEIEGFKETLEKAGQAVKAFVGYEVAKEAYEFVESTVEAAVQLKVMSERLGTTTDELQAMHLAAKEADVSVEAMDGSLRFLNRTLGDGGKHSATAKAEFQKLGIATKDASGHLRPAGDIMGDLADKIAEIEDPAKKTKLAIELLGRGGDQLIPLLNRGHEAFDEARKGMEELGGGMSTEFVEATEKASVAATHLGFAWTGLRAQIVNAILPGFIDVARGLTSIVTSAINLEKKTHILEDAFSVGKIALIVVALLKIKSTLESVTRAQLIAFATNPITLWLAGIAFAILIYNDLKTALEGGKSVFGDYFGQTGIKRLNEDLKIAQDVVDYLILGFESLYHSVNAFTSGAAGYLKSLTDDPRAKLEGTAAPTDANVGALRADAANEVDLAQGGQGGLAAVRARIAARHATNEPVGAEARQAQIEEYQAKYRARLPANGLGAAAGATGPSLVQHNDVKIEQHLGAGVDPHAVGAATKDGVQGAYARFKNNASLAGEKP